MALTLRPRQTQALQDLRQAYASGARAPVLVASGEFIAAEMRDRANADRVRSVAAARRSSQATCSGKRSRVMRFRFIEVAVEP